MRLIIRFVMMALLSTSARNTLAEEPTTVEFLRTVLTAHLQSVHTLTAHYQLHRSTGDISGGGAPWGPYEYDLVSDEQRVSLRVTQNRDDVEPYTLMYDGTLGYVVREKPGYFSSIQIHSRPPVELENEYQPLDPIGARVISADLPLPQLMEDPRTTLDGIDESTGSRCWRVSTSAIERTTGRPLLVTCLFDPAHEYLPRQIKVERLNDDTGTRRSQWTWVVTQFERTPEGSPLRWFPTRSELRLSRAVTHMSVQAFALNQEIPLSAFRPDTSRGAQVLDVRNPKEMKRYVLGDVATIDHHAAELVKSTRKPPSAEAASMSAATPNEGRFWLRLLLVASVLSLILGWVIRLRLR